ncbi:hypothetical protein, partial [Clostridium tarantellae]|uniref:hypothetical protein n=1 Tax=Clostridium tarantellae TaxID=39493 RepID=UPI00147814B3
MRQVVLKEGNKDKIEKYINKLYYCSEGYDFINVDNINLQYKNNDIYTVIIELNFKVDVIKPIKLSKVKSDIIKRTKGNFIDFKLKICEEIIEFRLKHLDKEFALEKKDDNGYNLIFKTNVFKFLINTRENLVNALGSTIYQETGILINKSKLEALTYSFEELKYKDDIL